MRISNMITAIDVHAAGEPGRVIVGGVLDVPGKTMFEKMVYLRDRRDDLRKRMLREPRGYPALCCNLVLPPTHPDADAGFVIMEQMEYPPMSGSNTICTATALLETGMIPMKEQVTELVTYVRGNYQTPLRERRFSKEFCLGCHEHESYAQLAEMTKALEEEIGANPHDSHYGELECRLCHKVHRASQDYCANCHTWGWKVP